MVFTTHIFLFYFLPLFLAVYFILPRALRNFWLTLASYVFYAWWEPWFVCLMMFTTVMDFIWGKVITRSGATQAQRKFAVAACVATNLSFLGFFKYYMFAAETLNRLLAAFGSEPFRVLTVVLPIGISFYTFHSLTYIIDLYRGHATPAKSFTDFSAFVALFPDLVAGPIIRYKTLSDLFRWPQLLANVKVVVWEFVERDIQLGTEGWQFIPLPPAATVAGAAGPSE